MDAEAGYRELEPRPVRMSAVGVYFDGHVPSCVIHERRGTYSPEHDAFYCAYCNRWLEDVCVEYGCRFCVSRPMTPMPVIPGQEDDGEEEPGWNEGPWFGTGKQH